MSARSGIVRRSTLPTRAWLQLAPAVAGIAVAGSAVAQTQDVLEEIIVTATRVETNLRQTPMSIQAFTGENLELGGIDNGLFWGYDFATIGRPREIGIGLQYSWH